ncbi:hypothetical protein FOL47_006158 [Perkinsus chesapeaki]|uniref:Uncharacterized protein n=1 Tax=Perkinsus chesapeaki TaxID=330153 RepID=A0A7J6LTH0_PERCH|nr:hypothetical protein FOL47_006158 [Perkinsus chesapeaki]
MFYESFECCQCSCSCHLGEQDNDYHTPDINGDYDDQEEEDEVESCTEKYLTVSSGGERDLHSRVGEVEREIELLRRRKQRLARRDDRWAVRSDGVVTCAGSDRTGHDSDSYETVDRFGGGYNSMTGMERDETVDRFGGYNSMTDMERDETVDRFGGGYNSMTGMERDETVDRFGGGYNSMTGMERDGRVDPRSDEQDRSRRLMEEPNEYDSERGSDNHETVDRFIEYSRMPRDTNTRKDETVNRFAHYDDVPENLPANRHLSQKETVDRFNKYHSSRDSEASDPPEFGLPAGERSDDELDKVISRLDTAETDASRSNRSTVSKPPKKENVGEEKPRMEVRPIPVLDVSPETNPADWDPNDFKAGYVMPGKEKVKREAKPPVKSRYMEDRKVGTLRNEISWGGDKSKASRYPTNGRSALVRTVSVTSIIECLNGVVT